MIKLESKWNCEEIKEPSRNFIVLHTIQCGMDGKTFGLIATPKFAKEA